MSTLDLAGPVLVAGRTLGLEEEAVHLLLLGPGGRAGARPSKQGLIADIEALYEVIVRLSREVHRSPRCCASTASSPTRAPRARPDRPPQAP